MGSLTPRGLCFRRSRRSRHRVRAVRQRAENLRRVSSAVGPNCAIRVRVLKALRVAPPALCVAGGLDLAIREPQCAIIDGLTGAASREPRTNCLTTFCDGAIVELSSTVASRSPLRIDRCGAHEPAAPGHGSFSSLDTLPGCHSRDTRPRIMRSIRIGVMTSGHGARPGALIRQFLEVRRAIHRRQRRQLR